MEKDEFADVHTPILDSVDKVLQLWKLSFRITEQSWL